MSEKIHKALARAGLGSRRQMEAWIQAGRVRIDNQVATVADRVTAENRIFVDDRSITVPQQIACRILMYHKPVGQICSQHDPEGRTTVFEVIPELRNARERWVMVGRLDINSSGLLLFTTDGELANRLMHPASELDREYAVRVLGEVSRDVIKQLLQGVELEDGSARFHRIRPGGGDGANHWYYVVIREGRKREVRRLWQSQGITVSRLIRTRFGPLKMPTDLRHSEYMELEPADIDCLRAAVGLA